MTTTLPLTNRPPVSAHIRTYVVECRDPETGRLDMNSPQPPFIEASEDRLSRYFFAQNPTVESASWETMGRWYAERRWFWRPKTW